MKTPQTDRMKLVASRLGPAIQDFTQIRAIHKENLARLNADQDHTQVWINNKRSELQKAWDKASSNLRRELDAGISQFEMEEARLRNPVLQCFGVLANGATNAVDDAALKAEFRGLMQTLPSSGRREWFKVLAESGDLGRIGVLVALEPSLSEDVLALPNADRDEALTVASKIKASLRDFANQDRLDRMTELQGSPNLTQGETLELLRTAAEVQLGQKTAQEIAANTFTEAEQARYHELSQKAEVGQLSTSEGREYMVLSGKLDRKTQAEQQKAPKATPPPVTDAEIARHRDLLNLTNPTPAQGVEMIRLGVRIQEAAGAKNK